VESSISTPGIPLNPSLTPYPSKSITALVNSAQDDQVCMTTV
jgi:hypothetical protein